MECRGSIPLVKYDFSLGYDLSMDYVADREHLEWKIRQLTSVLVAAEFSFSPDIMLP